MDFFENQERARRKTGRLVVFFLLAVLAIIAMLYALAVFVIGYQTHEVVGYQGYEATASQLRWWNPDLPNERHAYVLQHEQIHFALVELSARRLTWDCSSKARTFMAIQPTVAAARNEIQTTIKQWVRSAMEQSLDDHTAFDEDTSLFYSPRWQRWWLDKVKRELVAFDGREPERQAEE